MESWHRKDFLEAIKIKAKEDGVFNEAEAARIMLTFLNTLSCCHENGISVGNIRPENIQYSNQSWKYDLSDESVIVPRSIHYFSEFYYWAPEIFEGKLGVKSDIWSLGVILYIMLSGKLPFETDGSESMVDKIKTGKYTLTSPEWTGISKEAKNLIKQMMKAKYSDRITLK